MLEHGISPVGLDRSPPCGNANQFPFVQCDILDRALLRRILCRIRPDAIVHLAARTDLDEKSDISGYAANTEGVRNLLEGAQAALVNRIIYTSTQLVCRVGHVPRSDTEFCPDTLYGRSKAISEQMIRAADGGAPEWCIVRPTTVWGPHMNAHYQTMLRLIARGAYFHCGSGPLRKSYIYAENIAHQYVCLLGAPATAIQRRVFYLGDPEPLSLRTYADELARQLGAPRIRTMPLPFARILAHLGDVATKLGLRSIPFNTFRLRNILTEYTFDVSAIHALCGRGPVTPGEGIRQTAQWYLDLHPELARRLRRPAP